MKWLDPGHIRTRMMMAFVGALAAVLLLYSAAAATMLLRDLRRQTVRYAIQDLETVEGLLYLTADGQILLRDDYHNHPESKLIPERLLEVRSPDGRVLFANGLLGKRSLGDTILPHEGEGGYSSRSATLADGVKVQLVSRRHLIDGHPLIIRVAYEEGPLSAEFRSSLLALVLPMPIILMLAGVGGYTLASRALKPIERMTRNAEAITGRNLHERLPVNPSDGELADLARVFNSVLVRLEQSFEQLRRFTSDASHELRTPLAAMKSVGEVCLRKDGSTESYRDVIGSMLEEANQLTRLVDSLLTIARADAGRIEIHQTTFQAGDLMRECAGLFDAVVQERGQRLTIEIPEKLPVRGDWLLLRQALVNVIHNAIKFTPENGCIVARVIGGSAAGSQQSGRQYDSDAYAIFEIEDSGPGIPTEDLDKVFDRFYRADASRSRADGGAGLGLSIAKWNVEIHGGNISAHRPAASVHSNLRVGGGCLVRIALPSSGGE